MAIDAQVRYEFHKLRILILKLLQLPHLVVPHPTNCFFHQYKVCSPIPILLSFVHQRSIYDFSVMMSSIGGIMGPGGSNAAESTGSRT